MTSKVGDLVWAHVHGYPWWPGQVMDPERTTAKARKQATPGRVLISFFGDNSWGWYTEDALIPFAQHYEEKRSQQGLQGKGFKRDALMFAKAVAEAKEVDDRRSGRTPTTDHKPVDFLNADLSDADDSADEADEDINVSLGKGVKDLRPAEIQEAHARQCTASQAMQWLQRLATNLSAVQLDSEHAEAARRLTFAATVAMATPRKKPGRKSATKLAPHDKDQGRAEKAKGKSEREKVKPGRKPGRPKVKADPDEQRTEAKERKKRKLSTTPARNPKPKRLHESHVESNEVSPLDDAADEESLANDGAIEDVEVDGVAQMAVMEGGADSAEWAADSAPPPEHLQQLEQQQQRTAAARQPHQRPSWRASRR
ncbi:hypothetical protein WJX73_000807 [Symbiochloris irregularis]|uniref:PWWP domain-containing protein n=1 Tax=Symbiochloris irregularis TaxID=706552 RepID=A0AAW1NS41_9CHLO